MGWMSVTPVNVTKASSIFAALFLCSQHLSHVLTLDALCTFGLTLWITLFTRDRLTSAVADDRPIDALHEFLLLNMVSMLVVPALVWFFSIDPADVTIRTGLALSRALALGIATIVTVFSQHEQKLFDPEAFQMVMYPMVSVALLYIVHLFYNNAVNADRHVGNLNAHLHVDLILSLLVGFVCLFKPQLPAYYVFHQTLDELHTYLYRLYGAMLLGFCTLTYLGPKFRASANKRAVLFSKALCMLMMLLVTFRNYKRGDMPEGVGCKLLIAVLIVLTLPAAIGSMRNEYVPGWHVPWRGLRVPHISGTPTDNLINAAKDLKQLSKISPHRRQKLMRRSKSRRKRSGSRRRRGRKRRGKGGSRSQSRRRR